MFLGTAFEVEEPLPKVEPLHKCTGKKRRCEIHMMKDMVPKSTEQCQSCGKSICHTHPMGICNICLK